MHATMRTLKGLPTAFRRAAWARTTGLHRSAAPRQAGDVASLQLL